MLKRNVLLVLSAILILGFFLRFYKLNSIPNGPEWDEASVGYNAYSIAQTGRDEWGNKFPLIFSAFGDYKNPLYIYLTSIFVKSFGLNIVTTRAVNTITGFLMIIVWYFISKLITDDKRISILTAFLLAVSPFGIFYSRIAGDGIMLSVFLISTGVMFELLYLKKNRAIFFLSAIIFLLLSIFSYNLARIVSPILIFLILLMNIKITKNKYFYLPILILCSLFFFLVIKQSGVSLHSRLSYVGILGEGNGITLQINELREHDKNNLISKIFHNKATLSIITLAKNYVAYFSSSFLVGFNDNKLVFESQYPPLYLIMLPFYYLGIVLFVKNIFEKIDKKDKYGVFLLTVLLIVAPLPAAIADGISGKRSLSNLGIEQFLTAYGFYAFYHLLTKQQLRKKFIIAMTSLFIVSLFLYGYFYFYTFPKSYGKYYASRENRICQFIKDNYKNYDYFIYSKKIDGFAYIFPLYCLSFAPQKYWLTRNYSVDNGWYSVNSFDKFLFPSELNQKLAADLVKSKAKNIAIFMNEDENNNINLRLLNLKYERLAIPSEVGFELYLYKINLL